MLQLCQKKYGAYLDEEVSKQISKIQKTIAMIVSTLPDDNKRKETRKQNTDREEMAIESQMKMLEMS